MPTYEYKCDSCGHIFEKFQSMTDEPVKVCPKCGCEVRRVIHGGTGLIFKGSGWYVTDYGKGHSSATLNETSKEETKKDSSEKKKRDMPQPSSNSEN